MTRVRTSLRRRLFAVLAGNPGLLVKRAPEVRTEVIERQLRGFEATMAEVAYRSGEMYWGGADANWCCAEEMQRMDGQTLLPRAPGRSMRVGETRPPLRVPA